MADTPPEKTSAPKRGTRPSKTEAAILSDARHVVAVARKNLPAFVAADEGQTIKRVTATTLDATSQLIDAARNASEGQPYHWTGLTAQGTTEIQARASLLDLLSEARGRVATGLRNDPDLHATFGVGAHWTDTATAPLLKGAGLMLTAVKDDASVAAKAAAAGVGPSKIAAIAAARDALVTASEGHDVARSGRKTATVNKDGVFQELKGEVTYLREVAKSVFAKDQATLLAFGSVTSRHRPTPRKAPPAGAPAPKKPRGTSKTTKRIKLAVAATKPAPSSTPSAKAKAPRKAPAAKKSVKKGAAKKSR